MILLPVAHFHAPLARAFLDAELAGHGATPPDLDGVVVARGDEHLRVLGAEGDGIDDVVVGELCQANAVVSVPQVTMFVLCSAVEK